MYVGRLVGPGRYLRALVGSLCVRIDDAPFEHGRVHAPRQPVQRREHRVDARENRDEVSHSQGLLDDAVPTSYPHDAQHHCHQKDYEKTVSYRTHQQLPRSFCVVSLVHLDALQLGFGLVGSENAHAVSHDIFGLFVELGHAVFHAGCGFRARFGRIQKTVECQDNGDEDDDSDQPIRHENGNGHDHETHKVRNDVLFEQFRHVGDDERNLHQFAHHLPGLNFCKSFAATFKNIPKHRVPYEVLHDGHELGIDEAQREVHYLSRDQHGGQYYEMFLPLLSFLDAVDYLAY